MLAVRCKYHNSWSVELHSGEDPHEVAGQLDMDNLGGIGSITNHYLFKHKTHPQYSESHSHSVTSSIENHRKVRSATQQRVLRRVKRESLLNGFSRAERAPEFSFNDKYFPKQWYLYDDYNNVTGAWRQGVTGRGIVVTILDDGLERTHPDIQANYEARASVDLNDNDDDPMPRYDITNENKHGTRCAGEVASVADNEVCGVGAAYHSRIGGVRMLDGDVTDAIEAKALGLNQDFIDIYSASWGPDDDGRTVDGPGSLTVQSFTSGITDGRDGRGSIFVWASGNGGVSFDNCNCDGYTNSIWTLSIGSTSENGNKPWYAEECSSTLAVTYSSGSGKERQILSTDLHSKCTERHTGTSAAAPLAAGIFALVLQANPLLTWRDLQHLVVKTSKPRNLKEAEWATNGVGYNVSHKFGFGVIDAGGLVELAQLWNNVPDPEICEGEKQSKEKSIEHGREEKFRFTSDGCDGRIMFLEHVQSVITIQAEKRGDISLKLKSPSGTVTTLLTARKYDRSTKGFNKWPFLNVHTWGENPAGIWELIVKNNGLDRMKLISWELVMHGSTTQPELRENKISVPDFDNNSDSTCDSHCDQNFGCTGTGPGNCTACAHYLQQSTNICVDICGPGEHLNRKGTVCISHCDVGEYVNSAGQCDACDSNCETCNGPSATECIGCHSGSYLLLSEHKCVSACPQNTITKYGQCEMCHTDCFTCTDVGYDKCLTCQPSLFFLGNRCYQLCPSGFFGDSATKTCVACSDGCESCFGTGDNQCASCKANLYLAESRCQESCPASYYTTGDEHVCKRCHYTCKACAGDSIHQCESCISNLFLLSGDCLRECPSGYTPNSTTGTCDKCADNCSACSGVEANQCTGCVLHFRLDGNVCNPACPEGQYSSESTGKCKSCGHKCLSCSGPDDCTSCNETTFRYKGECLTKCPVSMFKRDRACLPCDKAGACSECDAVGTCTNCKEGYKLSQGSCNNPCERGLYLKDDACHTCPSDCAACNGPSEYSCTACKDSTIESLRVKYNYQNEVYCGGCSGGCELCLQQYDNYCVSCHPGKHLLRDKTLAQRAQCVEACPAGTFPTQTNGLSECVHCHESCSECNGPSATSCASCGPGLLLEESSCVAQCSESFYLSGTACLPCDNICKSCNGPGSKSCLTCPPGFVNQAQECVHSCSSGFFQRGDSCEACHPTCLECSGESAHQCSKCIAGFSLAGESCVNACSQGLFNDPTLNTCKPCHVTCTNCTNEGPAQCLTCKAPLVKNTDNNECWQCCNEGARDRCCYCSGSNINTCTLLAENFEKHDASTWSSFTRYVVGGVLIAALLGVLIYPLYHWKNKQAPTYSLLNDQDSDETDRFNRINEAYRVDEDDEDFVAMIHS